jgi:hypothetical protein
VKVSKILFSTNFLLKTLQIVFFSSIQKCTIFAFFHVNTSHWKKIPSGNDDDLHIAKKKNIYINLFLMSKITLIWNRIIVSIIPIEISKNLSTCLFSINFFLVVLLLLLHIFVVALGCRKPNLWVNRQEITWKIMEIMGI